MPRIDQRMCIGCRHTTVAGSGPQDGLDDSAGAPVERLVQPRRVVEAADYEPKMNVTPNAVATKD